MDWSASTLWWLMAGGLVAAELATGTFYLLMLALGAGGGALAAHAGLATQTQVLTAALIGGGAVLLWHRLQLQRKAQAGSTTADQSLDIGRTVHVSHWRADGSTRVDYRGTQWDARLARTESPGAGNHVICAVEGNCLVLERIQR
jgi:membrane protein implicated in regulation of membrane protease activity